MGLGVVDEYGKDLKSLMRLLLVNPEPDDILGIKLKGRYAFVSVSLSAKFRLPPKSPPCLLAYAGFASRPPPGLCLWIPRPFSPSPPLPLSPSNATVYYYYYYSASA